MIIDHADSLHISITDRRTKEFEPPFFHILTDRVGDGRGGHDFRGVVEDGFPLRHKTIQVIAKGAEFFLNGEKKLCGADGGADL